MDQLSQERKMQVEFDKEWFKIFHSFPESEMRRLSLSDQTFTRKRKRLRVWPDMLAAH